MQKYLPLQTLMFHALKFTVKNILQNQLKMFGVYYIYVYTIIFIRVRCCRPAGCWRRQDTVFYSQLLLSVWSGEMNKMLRVTK